MKLYAWQWKSLFLCAVALTMAFYAASFLPYVKPSYAQTQEITTLKEDVQKKFDATNRKLDATNQQVSQLNNQIRIGQIRGLNTDLIDARRYQCRGINGDRSLLPFWNGRIQDLKQAWRDLVGSEWPNMDCNTF